MLIISSFEKEYQPPFNDGCEFKWIVEMKKWEYNRILILMLSVLCMTWGECCGEEYVVLVGKSVRVDKEWQKVVDRLVELHEARVVEFNERTSEALPQLRELAPRYVAIVEKPENIDISFVVDLNRMSRNVDDDIYCDFLWGIITGYDADSALALVERAQTAKVVRSAWCMRNNDFSDGRYFEEMGLCDSRGVWFEKDKNDCDVRKSNLNDQIPLADQMVAWAEDVQPDLIVYQVEELRNRMPLFAGVSGEKEIVLAREGKLWLHDHHLELGKHSRVYFSQMGGAQTFVTKESIPVVWMNDGGVTAFVGSATFSFHGRGTWGTLKYWLTDAGRFTLAEAYFLNQQDILWHLAAWDPDLLQRSCQYSDDPIKMVTRCYTSYDAFRKEIDASDDVLDRFGLWYERDIWVYYGDPCWNVRMKDVSGDQPYRVTSKIKGKKCIVTIEMSEKYTWNRLCGDFCYKYDMGHLHGAVGSLPICYLFPQRLKNPRLSPGRKNNWDVTVNKDFLFIRNAFYLEPGKVYQLVLDVDK